MTYIVTAWKLNTPGTIHHQHLLTVAAVNRLLELLLEQTRVDYITIRMVREDTSDQLPLPGP